MLGDCSHQVDRTYVVDIPAPDHAPPADIAGESVESPPHLKRL